MSVDKIYFLCDASNKYAEDYIKEFSLKNNIEEKTSIWYITKKLHGHDMTASIPELKTENPMPNDFYSDVFVMLTEHYTLVRQAYERNFKNIIVVDRNIIFNSNFNINNIIEEIPNDANIVSFTSDKYANSGNYFAYQDNIKEPENIIYYLDRDGMKHFYESLDNNFASKNIPFENIKEPLKMAACNYNLLKY